MTHHTDERATLLKIERSLMGRSLDEWVMETGAVALNSSWHGELAAIVRMAFDKGVEVEQAARRAPLVTDTRARYSGSIQELRQYASEDVDAMVHICNKHIGNVPKGFFLAMQECAALVGRAPAVPTRNQIEQYLYEQGVVTVSRKVAEAAGLARLEGKMQSAPAVPVPQGWHAPGLGEVHNAAHDKMIYCADAEGVACNKLAQEVLAALAAAPQSPDAFKTEDGLMCENSTSKPVAGCSISNGETKAAPVQMPEPVGCTTKPWGVAWNTSQIEAGSPLYTEQQVRELLAANGIEVAP